MLEKRPRSFVELQKLTKGTKQIHAELHEKGVEQAAQTNVLLKHIWPTSPPVFSCHPAGSIGRPRPPPDRSQ